MKNELEIIINAKYKIKKYSDICGNFEDKYGMDSEIFMERFNAGKLGDRDDLLDWYAAKGGLKIWNKKIKVISAIEYNLPKTKNQSFAGTPLSKLARYLTEIKKVKKRNKIWKQKILLTQPQQ
ncbi:hypothetical protein MSHOH_1233 [Methanosarcina horonobensis HB-1 = JCM 15518]|uniref:Uncharacterized protein n=1 Tax=Methanosarcina horonobensis HB-1 = JCM 15518 TaxID=1434110 RepID=A0A0E3SAC2_9EURY|nr:hypothetical protein [Methanosarcina horonobensis]AKB77716.1 hypothetical protein MSHOH_1233 [Methanosarcina horonobensis HB-1 = JCM 15518]